MTNLTELLKGLGPETTKELLAAQEAAQQAQTKVDDLNSLLATRRSEQEELRVLAAPSAGVAPAALAQNLGLAQATDQVIAQIEADLKAAQGARDRATRALGSARDRVIGRRRLIDQKTSEIAKLAAERDAIQAELAR
jgi:hypothetical protein